LYLDGEAEKHPGGTKLTRVVFATKNKGKVREIREMLAGLEVELLSLLDFPNVPEIKEDGQSYLENALKKAITVAEFTGEMALADDSGLEVDALDGDPGIYSARFAGKDATDTRNVQKLLETLNGVPPEKRGASFQCVLVICRPDGVHAAFTGRWNGRIHNLPLGEGGFGYDPVFFLPDQGVTVAQLPGEAKNRLSHRAQAFVKLREWLLQMEKL
jgi:XTP/dITP diphosphohydrolase